MIGDKDEVVLERCRRLFENPVYRQAFQRKLEEAGQKRVFCEYWKTRTSKALGGLGDYFDFMVSGGLWMESLDEEEGGSDVQEHRVYLGRVEEEFNRIKKERGSASFSEIWSQGKEKEGQADRKDIYVEYMANMQRHEGSYAGEAFQNSYDGGAKNFNVRYYKKGKYLIEDIEDDGHGVENLAYLLLLDRSTKTGEGTIGNKGIGSLALLSGISKLEIYNQRDGFKEELFLRKDKNQMWYCTHYKKEPTKGEGQTGLRYRRYLESSVPELDVLRLRDNWQQQIGYALSRVKCTVEVGGQKVLETMATEDVPLKDESVIHLRRYTDNKREDQELIMVDRVGLFMRTLVWREDEKDSYLQLVPNILRDLILKQGLIFVFDGELTRSRDRPKEEDVLLLVIQKKIRDAVLEYICQQLLKDFNFHCPQLPRDYFTHYKYDKKPLLEGVFLTMLLTKEFVPERGETVTTLKDFRLKIKNIEDGLESDSDETGQVSKFLKEREFLKKQSPTSSKWMTLKDQDLSKKERNVVERIRYLLSHFKGALSLVIFANDQNVTNGFYEKKTIYIRRNYLYNPREELIESVIHECAHYLEDVYFGGNQCQGTHHNDGPFSLCYRLACWFFLDKILEEDEGLKENKERLLESYAATKRLGASLGHLNSMALSA